jgi:hypothetical protein
MVRGLYRMVMALLVSSSLVVAIPALANEARWTVDLGATAGWESDIGDDLEQQGHPAPHGGVWVFGGRALPLGDAHRLHLGAGYSARLVPAHSHLSSQGLVGEVALLWLPGERWLLRIAPWAAARVYGDRARDSVLGGLAGVARYQATPRVVLRAFARAGAREAAHAGYATRSAGAGAGLEIDLAERLWAGVGYGLEGARWTASELPGDSGFQPGATWPPAGPIGSGGGGGGFHLLAHVLSTSLNLELDGAPYLFVRYDLSWLAPAGGGGWAVHALAGGVGLRR